ncbi:MAG TPA: dihydrodipicolinate synthase family protein [Opitutaceae bacterium]|nr:dihydrodipicolinate synthase family protein [Opitutaceae bacterium]
MHSLPDHPTTPDLGRRRFLQSAGALALGAYFLKATDRAEAADVDGAHLATPSGKPLRGLFPILETPFTPEDKLDTDALAAEVKFCNRGRLGGMIWPVFASSWSTLSDAERIEGAETILAAGKGGKSAIAIAVQNMAWDVSTSVRYAKHAAAHGADAIVAIPPNNGWNVTDQAVIDYYKAIGSATDLPLVVQTRGTISVDLLVRIFQEVPTVKATKDEVGNPLERIGELIKRTDNKLAIWAAGGGTGDQLLQELPLGFAGLCPTPQYSDLLQQVMELYWAGKQREAFDMFGRVQAFASIPGASAYMMVARGVFKETTKSRPQPMEPEAPRPAGGGRGGAGGGGGGRGGPPTDAQKKLIREGLEKYLRPYLRA